MIVFQIPDPMVYDLDLFFHHRHTLCKMVMLPHLARQFLQLCIGNSPVSYTHLTLPTILRV